MQRNLLLVVAPMPRAGQIRQYGTITLTKFTDSEFTLSTVPEDIIQINKVNLDSDVDQVLFSLSQNEAEKNTGAGTVLPFSTAGGNAQAEIMMYQDEDRTNYNFVSLMGFRNSILNSDGKIEHYTQPGTDGTDFRNLVSFRFVPIDAEENPDDDNDIVMPRCKINLEEGDKMGQPNSIKIIFKGIGGERKATLQSTADLSSGIDLSAGGTDKIVKMTMIGRVIDVNFLQSAATNQATIIGIINAAFGVTVVAASTVPSADFLLMTSTVNGAPIVVEDPAVGVSGLTAVFGFTVRTFVKGVVPRIIK